MISLRQAVADVSGASFIGLDTVTTPVLTGGKKNPMKGRIQKHMEGANVMVFQNKNSSGYENMVKRRLEGEGKNPESFNVQARKWGERVPNMPIVSHKGNDYLEVIVLKSGTVHYTLDGQPIDRADITGLKTSPEGDQGGLEDKVFIRDFKAESIKTIRIDGQSITF